MNDLTEVQIAIEQEALAMGQEQYLKELQKHADGGTEDQTAPGRALIRRFLDSVTEAVTIKRQPQGRGRRHAALALLEGVEDQTLAFHVLRQGVASLSSQDRGLTRMAEATGRAVLDELNFRRWSEQDAQRYKITQTHMKGNTSGARRREIAGRMFRLSEINPVTWTSEQSVCVGLFLIDCLVAVGGWEIKTITVKRGMSETVVQASPELIEWANDAHSRMSLMQPVRLPMVVTPRPWTSPSDGGYLTDLGGRLNMIKTRNRGYLESLHDVDMPAVYAAINRVQGVAWQVNPSVLHVAQQCWAAGIEVGSSMPCREPAPVPAPPVPREELNALKKSDRPRYAAWAQKAAAVYEANAKGLCKRLSAATKLNIAEKFADYPAIYFPHQLDFRGRIYAAPNHLNPQSDDLARGLLRFAEGKPMGERGLWWIKVHIANCWGVDKVSHAERVRWTEEHMDELLDSGIDPMGGNRFWMTADDPWQALAAIFELVSAQLNGPDNVLTRLPIPQDGTCNGLQNFSALLRDPVGGKATNLVPQDKPADIYSEVAVLVSKQVRIDAEAGNVHAIMVDGKINRKIVKQPVMTLPYGATKNGMRDQIDAALKKTYPGEFPVKETWNIATYLADVTWDAIGRVVVAAVSAMDWMRGVARVAASEEYPLRWTTPIGLPVLQDYRESEASRLDVHVNGQRVQLNVARDGDKLSKRRQATGISPNFVHSLDAAHLMRTVLLAEDNGLQHFALIHDSYGVHACDTDLLHACIREAFVEQYSEDLLGRFKAELEEQLPPELAAELPEVPPMGTLDLDAVKQSAYFFA